MPEQFSNYVKGYFANVIKPKTLVYTILSILSRLQEVNLVSFSFSFHFYFLFDLLSLFFALRVRVSNDTGYMAYRRTKKVLEG